MDCHTQINVYVKVELLDFINEELGIGLNVSFYVLFIPLKLKLSTLFSFKPLVYLLVLVKITHLKLKRLPLNIFHSGIH